ncbi:hypothetical protein ACLOJK_034955 [Asimina triloba]
MRRVQICRNHLPPSSAAARGGDDIRPSTAHIIPPSLRSSSIANLAPSIIKLRFFRANPTAPIPPPATHEAILTSFSSALIQPLACGRLDGRLIEASSGMVGLLSAEHRRASLASSMVQAGTRGRRRADSGSWAESGCWGPPEATRKWQAEPFKSLFASCWQQHAD